MESKFKVGDFAYRLKDDKIKTLKILEQLDDVRFERYKVVELTNPDEEWYEIYEITLAYNPIYTRQELLKMIEEL